MPKTCLLWAAHSLFEKSQTKSQPPLTVPMIQTEIWPKSKNIVRKWPGWDRKIAKCNKVWLFKHEELFLISVHQNRTIVPMNPNLSSAVWNVTFSGEKDNNSLCQINFSCFSMSFYQEANRPQRFNIYLTQLKYFFLTFCMSFYQERQ